MTHQVETTMMRALLQNEDGSHSIAFGFTDEALTMFTSGKQGLFKFKLSEFMLPPTDNVPDDGVFGYAVDKEAADNLDQLYGDTHHLIVIGPETVEKLRRLKKLHRRLADGLYCDLMLAADMEGLYGMVQPFVSPETVVRSQGYNPGYRPFVERN